MESMLQNFVVSYFTVTYVLLDELIPFHGKQFGASFNKKSYRYLCSVKSHWTSVMKVLSTLLLSNNVKQYIYWLLACLRSVIERTYLINKHPQTYKKVVRK